MRGKQRRLCVGKALRLDPPLFVLSIEGLGIAPRHGTLQPDARMLDFETMGLSLPAKAEQSAAVLGSAN